MSKEGKFLIFCIEVYKAEKHLTGAQTLSLFKKYDIQDYILSCYEALHTTGESYIVEDIDLFIRAREAG